MALAKRIIPCLDVDQGRVVKGVNFMGIRDAGDPVEIARRYNEAGADEFTFLDITASHEERDTTVHTVEQIAREVFIPLTVGGGVRSLQDIRTMLNAGADKVSINTAAVEKPDFIKEASDKFGSQCIVVCLDLKPKNKNKWELFKNFGKNKSDLEVVSWIQKVQELGAGEILLQSIDRDGTGKGYDLNLLKFASKYIHVPFVILGGAGKFDDFIQANKVNKEVSLGAANIFHFTEHSILNAKKFLSQSKMNVRTF